MKSLIASRPYTYLLASNLGPAVEALTWVWIGSRAVAVEGAWPSAGRRPVTLGVRLAAPGALCYALLGSLDPLAGALIAGLGLQVGWA